MPRKPNYGPKYSGILVSPVEKWNPPLSALDTDEKVLAWRDGEIDRVKSELQKRHDALFVFYEIKKDDPDALNRLHLALCTAHVPGFQVIEDQLPQTLNSKSASGKVVSLFPERKNKRRSERWKEFFVNSILLYQTALNVHGHCCTDEEACGWFIDNFEDESLKRPGNTTRRKQRTRTLANVLSASRSAKKIRTHKVGAPVS
jgi:hypothetical protein